MARALRGKVDTRDDAFLVVTHGRVVEARVLHVDHQLRTRARTASILMLVFKEHRVVSFV